MEGNARPLRFVIALVATFFVGTTNIQPGDDAASMANALLRQRSSALTEVYIQLAGAIAFLFFLAGISSILRRGDVNARVFAPLAFGSGLAAGALVIDRREDPPCILTPGRSGSLP